MGDVTITRIGTDVTIIESGAWSLSDNHLMFSADHHYDRLSDDELADLLAVLKTWEKQYGQA